MSCTVKLLGIWALFLSLSASAKPLVVTTIKPLALIVADIGGDDVEVKQLLPVNNSLHHYSLKVSDRKLLSQADLTIWVGSLLESFVAKILGSGQAVIEWQSLPGLQWTAESTEVLEHDTGHGHLHEHAESETLAYHDPHLWLNPYNARVLAAEISQWLQRYDPGHQAEYRQRLQQFNDRLSVVDLALKEQFAGQPYSASFIVQHDAYGHFIENYGLNQAGSLRTVSGAKVGAKTLHAIETGQTEHACIFSDPQFDPRPANNFSQRTGVKVVELDPLGQAIEPGGEYSAYAELLRYFSRQFSRCVE